MLWCSGPSFKCPRCLKKGSWAWGGVNGWFCTCLSLCQVYIYCAHTASLLVAPFLGDAVAFQGEKFSHHTQTFTGPAGLGLCHTLPHTEAARKTQARPKCDSVNVPHLGSDITLFHSSIRVSPENRQETFIVNNKTVLEKLLWGKFINISSTIDETCPGPLTEKTIYSQEIKLLNYDILI